MPAYASGTDVSVIRSIGELDKMLTRHGATGFAYHRDDYTNRTRVMFRIADRMCRFEIEKPNVQDYRRTPTGRGRALATATQHAEAEEKRRWRSLTFVVKALLVGIADGVISLSDAFLPYTVLPGGDTVGEWASERLDVIYATGEVPELSLGPQRRAIEAP